MLKYAYQMHKTACKKGSDQLLYLKKARQEKNITQDELAHILGITIRTYQYIEYGQRKPSYDVILKLQVLFKSNIEVILSSIDDTL